MIVISHRGYWINVKEKNTIEAFVRSFTQGFGVETDIRDIDGQLVISHDPANHFCMPLERFFQLYLKQATRPTLALNVKADGLQTELKRQLTIFGIENYFVFDMAVPDGLLYIKRNMIAYTRQSEYEQAPSYYNLANGVWLDEFDCHWITDEVVEQHVDAGKAICIVSPELHNRSYFLEWEHYRELDKKFGKNRLMICTDFPQLAEDFFNGQD
jgi:glycerophosphoryl diester phosphodiesterase